MLAQFISNKTLAATTQIRNVLLRLRFSRPMPAKTLLEIKVNRKQRRLKSLSQLHLTTISAKLTASYLRHFSMKHNLALIKTSRFPAIEKHSLQSHRNNNSHHRRYYIMVVLVETRASNCSNRPKDLQNQVNSEILAKKVGLRLKVHFLIK